MDTPPQNMPQPLPPPLREPLWHPRAGLRLGAACAVLLLGGALAFVFASPLQELTGQISQGCIFHKYTGIKCPGCGGTRALRALLRGEWGDVLRYNAFWLPTLLILLQEAFVRLCCAAGFRATRYYRSVYIPSLKLYAAGVIIWFVARNIMDC